MGWGFWPVCVAPVLAQNSQKTVYYWGIGYVQAVCYVVARLKLCYTLASHGTCCTKQPMTCSDWNSPGRMGGLKAVHNVSELV